MGTKQSKQTDIELEPDAWRRFERAVDVVAKSPPQHRTKPKKTSDPTKENASHRKRKTK